MEYIPKRWSTILNNTKETIDVLNKIFVEYKNRKVICPLPKYIFKVFEHASPENLHTVIVGQDPYPQPGVANGIPFDCSNTNIIQPSLRYIQEELEYNKYPGLFNLYDITDLSPLLKDGILLLNKNMTVEAYKPLSHKSIWEDWIKVTVYNLSLYRDLHWILLGNEAALLKSYIESYKTLVTGPHPAAEAYKAGTFIGSNVFKHLELPNSIINPKH